MARKRRQEKKRTQHSKLLGRLERLALRREDDKFLRLAAEVPDLESANLAGVADLYRQVFARHLWYHLRKADLERVAELLEGAPATATALPVGRVARAVLALDAGRLEDARRDLEQLEDRLKASDGGSCADGSAPPAAELARQLSALVTGEGHSTGEGPIADFCKLRRSLTRYGAGEIRRLPSNLRLDWAPARDTLELVRALAALQPEKRPNEKSLGRVRRSARALLAHQPLDSGVETLASAAIRLTRAARSEALTKGLDHDLQRVEVDRLLQVLHLERSKLAAISSDQTFAALAGLRDLVTRQCRRLLARLVETGGSTLLARAHTAAGGAFDDFIEVTGEADNVEIWGAVHNFLDQEDYPALARWLEAASAIATDVSSTTQLWALELAFLERSIDAEDDENDNPFTALDDDKPPKPPCALRQMLVRLLAMSRQLERRSAGEDERRSVTRFLRNRLAGVLCRGTDEGNDERTLEVAKTLLRFLPDDATLLLVAFGAAIGGEQRSIAEGLAERIRQRGSAPEAELPRLRALLDETPTSSARQLDVFLRGVEPLFGSAWPEVRSAAAKVLEGQTLMALTLALHTEWNGFPDEGREIVRNNLEEIEALRPIFGNETSFHVARFLTKEAFSPPATFRRACEGLLAEHQDLETALAVVGLLGSLSAAPPAVERSAVGREVAIEALLRRLDGRWSLWGHVIEALLPQLAEQGQLKHLVLRLGKILGDTTLANADRQRIEGHLEHAKMLASALKSIRRPPKRPRKRRAKKKAARPPSHQLDLFERVTPEDES